jgi:DNA-binding transcriptional MerR regulator
MLSENAVYPIKAVARLTGLTADTIRAWERRYAAIAPQRTEGGHRLYSSADVARLSLLQRALVAGQSIGRVAHLSDEALRALAAQEEPNSPLDPAGADRILAAIVAFDHAAAETELRRCSMLLTPRQLVYDVALPLMEAIGLGWRDGRVGIAQEHFATSLLRSLLGTLLRLSEQHPDRSPLVLATLPGELHEMGLLCVALIAATRGVPTVYLGPQVPVAELAAAARATRAFAVGLGISAEIDPEPVLVELQTLASALPANQLIWLGGRGAGALEKDRLPAKCRLFLSLADAELALDGRAQAARG